MRQLLPHPADTVDLDVAYGVPRDAARHVRVNFVASADGAAELGGRSDPISGAADKAVFALLRGHTDVVLVGAGTVRAEGYGAVRTPPERQRWRTEHGYAAVPPLAVVTRTLDLDLTGRLFAPGPVRPLLLTTERAPADAHAAAARVADVIACGESQVDLALALDALADRGLRHVLCEGGPELFGHLLAAGCLDELCLTLSPLLGGAQHRRIVSGPALAQPFPLALGHVLEDDGTLFLRYVATR